MATAMNVSAWSTTAASNDGADSTIGSVANGSAPNTVDDWVRGIMAAVKRYVLDTDGGITSAGTADALTITTNRVISSGHQAAGFRVCFKAGNTNTGAATVAVDGLTAVSIKRFNGDALSAGDITAGGIYDIAFDGTNYKLMGISGSGGGGGVDGTLTGDNTWSGANSWSGTSTFTGAVVMTGAVTAGDGAGDVVKIKGTTVNANVSALFSSSSVAVFAQAVLDGLGTNNTAPSGFIANHLGTYNFQTLASAAINLLSTSNIAINTGAVVGTTYLLARDNNGLRWINSDHPIIG